ncbi:hypothetical protein DSECCO2_79230 [anaerobic digester metagenome]
MRKVEEDGEDGEDEEEEGEEEEEEEEEVSGSIENIGRSRKKSETSEVIGMSGECAVTCNL